MHKINIDNADVIIIPEQHLYHKAITTVPEMVKDNAKIIQDILTTIQELTNPIVIFMGDIVHRGIKNTEDSYFIEDYFRSLNQLTNGMVLSVVGNHELSYRKNNPFWGASFIDSEYIKSVVKHTYNVEQPIIGVVDDMIINDTMYAFGHYGRSFSNTYFTPQEVKQVVLLSHDSLICDEIINAFNDKGSNMDKRFLKVKNLHNGTNMPRTTLLKYVYVGHLHKAHGVFHVQEEINGIELDFIIRYLASLGRTNHSEYTNDNTRELPIHVFRGGKFIEERFHTIELPDREVSVDEQVVLENREAYDRQKANRRLKTVEASNMNLMSSITSFIENDEKNPVLLDLFERTKTCKMDDNLIAIIDKYRSW